jgi:hypothetical protein
MGWGIRGEKVGTGGWRGGMRWGTVRQWAGRRIKSKKKKKKKTKKKKKKRNTSQDY